MTQWGLDTLFNPAKRHMDEEKRRLQSTREEVGDNSGGKRVDFESGKVRINKTDDDPGPTADAEDAAADATGTGEAETASNKRGRKQRRSDRDEDGRPSDAAIRAAKRRGRAAT